MNDTFRIEGREVSKEEFDKFMAGQEAEIAATLKDENDKLRERQKEIDRHRSSAMSKIARAAGLTEEEAAVI